MRSSDRLAPLPHDSHPAIPHDSSVAISAQTCGLASPPVRSISAAMHRRSIHREHMEVPAGFIQFNPLAPVPTPKDLHSLLNEVGTAEAWAKTHGLAEGHEERIYGAVARMLKMGAAQWDWGCNMQWEDVIEMFPTATPASYWIMINSEHVGDKGLYQRLAVLAPGFFDHVWNVPFANDWSKKALLAVAHDANQEGLGEWLDAMEAWSQGASATTTGNPTGKGKGFRSSKGNRKGKS